MSRGKKTARRLVSQKLKASKSFSGAGEGPAAWQLGEQLAEFRRAQPMQLGSVLESENLDFLNNDHHYREKGRCL